MKHTLATLCTLGALSLTTVLGACSSDPMKKATSVMEAVAAEAEKSGGDCAKFAAAAQPIAAKNADAFKAMAEMMKGADKEAMMKKLSEYAPRMAEVRKKLAPIKAACRQHEGAKAVMASLRGR